MSITARDIQEQAFESSRKGYDVEEVDIFLERVAEEVDILCMQNQELKNRVADLQAQLAEAQAAANSASAAPTFESGLSAEQAAVYELTIRDNQCRIAELEEQLAQKGADAAAISAAIISAQKSADAIREEAREEGERIYRDAEDKARGIIREALAEKQEILKDLARLKTARENFHDEYVAMIKRFAIEGEKEFKNDVAANAMDPQDLASVNAVQAGAAPDLQSAAFNAAPAAAPQARYAAPSAAGRYAAPAPQARVADLSGFGDTDDDFGMDELN